ncbi:hypothetical protein ABH940_003581 [Streptacidiphilus sp. BW17]|uniref:hypothetical protein n=1 Tax=Streptacidiphilus sp. BW17 TaxID=3156274 RepID=UPI00351814CD
MDFPEIAARLAHDIPEARRLVARLEGNSSTTTKPVYADVGRSLTSALCHLSAIGMTHVSNKAGMFTKRARTRPLTPAEAEQVHRLVAEVIVVLAQLDKAPGRSPEVPGYLAELQRLLAQIDATWGRYQGKAQLYIPFALGKTVLAGGVERISATAKFRGITFTGLAGQNSDPDTPKVAQKNLMASLGREIDRNGIAWEALPIRPAQGPAAEFTATAR